MSAGRTVHRGRHAWKFVRTITRYGRGRGKCDAQCGQSPPTAATLRARQTRAQVIYDVVRAWRSNVAQTY